MRSPAEEQMHAEARAGRNGLPKQESNAAARNIPALVRTVLGRAPIAQREHLLEALCLSVASDGELREAELEAVRDINTAVRGVAPVREAKLMEHLTRCAAEVQVRGPAVGRIGALEEAMRDEPLRAREEVLSIATLIQYVDGELSDDEEDFLDALAQALGLTLEQAQAVVERVEEAILCGARGTREARSTQ